MGLREEMIGLVEEFNGCGMTQGAFSDSKGISFHKFNYWYRKLKKENHGEGLAQQFIKVDTRSAKVSDDFIELLYPNGVKIKLGASDVELVCRLVRVF
jgi:hypothetical protein